MGNSDILISRYMSIEGKNRQIFKKNCNMCSNMREVIQLTKRYFTEYAKAFNGAARKLGYLLEIHEEEFKELTSFKEILEKVYCLGAGIEQKGLTTPMYYNISTAIAYYHNVKVDMIYLSSIKAQRAFKNFLKDDYDKLCIKYRKYHCFNKKDMPEMLNSLEEEEEEIAEIISLNSDIFGNYIWKIK